MMIDRKIQRYVKDVVAFLPARMKNGAEQEISEMITDLVRDYAGDREPDILDARKVIEELGDPEMMALSWLETAEEMKRDHAGLPHGGSVIRSGVTGINKEHGHVIEYSLKLDSNPEFTGSVLAAYARAVARLAKEGRTGAVTVFDVAPAYLSPADPAELRAHLL